MGMNESGWRNPDNLEYIQGPDFVPGESSYGDLQMITPTWNYWSKKLGLKEKNRKNFYSFFRKPFDTFYNLFVVEFIFIHGKQPDQGKMR